MGLTPLPERNERVDLPPFAALRAFEAVGRSGGIRRAATLLSVDHAIISRHLRTLESWLGVTLYNRSNGLGLTATGERYFTRISMALQELSAATEDVTQGSSPTTLRISAVPGFGVNWMASRLPAFMTQFPEIEFEFRPTHDLPDFARQEADIDIRFAPNAEGPALAKGVRAMLLSRPGGFAVASPEYLKRVPAIQAPVDLLKCTLLHEEDTLQWQRFFSLHGIPGVTHLKGPLMWAASATLEAARAGEGVALTNRFLIGDGLQSGRLILVGPAEASGFKGRGGGGYWLTALEARWQQTPVAQFRRWMAAQMEEVTN